MNEEMSDQNDSLLAENERLRAMLEEQRQREMVELRQRLAEAEAKVEHYRSEAQRNADVGRQLAAEYEKKITELKAKVDIYERTDLRASRNK